MNIYSFFGETRRICMYIFLLGLTASSLILSSPTLARSRQLASAPATASQEPVVFVHGIDPAAIPTGLPDFIQEFMDSQATSCQQYWGDALRYMGSNSHGSLNWMSNDFRTLKFYNAETDC